MPWVCVYISSHSKQTKNHTHRIYPNPKEQLPMIWNIPLNTPLQKYLILLHHFIVLSTATLCFKCNFLCSEYLQHVIWFNRTLKSDTKFSFNTVLLYNLLFNTATILTEGLSTINLLFSTCSSFSVYILWFDINDYPLLVFIGQEAYSTAAVTVQLQMPFIWPFVCPTGIPIHWITAWFICYCSICSVKPWSMTAHLDWAQIKEPIIQ